MFYFCLFILNFFGYAARDMWDLSYLLGMEATLTALKVWSLEHWNTREVLKNLVLTNFLLGFYTH